MGAMPTESFSIALYFGIPSIRKHVFEEKIGCKNAKFGTGGGGNVFNRNVFTLG